MCGEGEYLPSCLTQHGRRRLNPKQLIIMWKCEMISQSFRYSEATEASTVTKNQSLRCNLL